MISRLRIAGAGLVLFWLLSAAQAAPQAVREPQRLTVTAKDYRISLHAYRFEWQLELRDRTGQWRTITKKRMQPEFAVTDSAGVHTSADSPVRLRHEARADAVVVGLTTVLPSAQLTLVRLDLLCTDDGLLLRFCPQPISANAQPASDDTAGYWAVPRLLLDERLFDSYAYWRAPDELRTGRIASLGGSNVFAGVSAWGGQGDTARRLSARHPAVIARSESAGLALGVVCLDYETRWNPAHSFLQLHTAEALYFYPGLVGRRQAESGVWAWLAPFPAEAPAAAEKVVRLIEAGRTLTAKYQTLAPEPEEHWTKPLPDFPLSLRRTHPVEDLRQAIVYTVNEPILTDDNLDTVRKTGSDVLIRGWFKWGTAPDFRKLAPLVPKAHELGALFGGGITCSALYHGESGLSEAQVLDMATRGPAGQLINAWTEANCRHGSLSSPAYREFLLDSCRKQIDCGVDYLFMDEINAVLQGDEGFDDYSNADFRKFLVERAGKLGWSPTDKRWHSDFQIDLANRELAPDGTMGTFQYRAYLKARGLTANPHGSENPLASQWHAFRDERDDRAWKWLTDAIRAHAAQRGRRVYLSGNGVARYVDLQVLGVWENWRAQQGRIDLSESQLDQWSSTVAAGWGLAERRVPVVLFHDWGFGGFPWLEVPPEDRRLWIRIRGAEIYAAGGFFAFPVRGPFGNDARQDGTLAEVARQSAFYHRHSELYLNAELLGFEPLETTEPALSLALWRRSSPPGLILHVINRRVERDQPQRRKAVSVRLPVERLPQAVRVVSPDWAGEKAGTATATGPKVTVTVPELEAYSVAVLDYDALPAVTLSGRRVVPGWQWARPSRNEFVVQRGGLIRDQWALPGMLQGKLHQHLRNPPTFLVQMPQGGSLKIHVRGVATLGARLEWQVDGQVSQTIDLPDRDGKNDAQAPEYDRTYELPIPPGRHRLSLDNIGGDWACLGWYAFTGECVDP